MTSENPLTKRRLRIRKVNRLALFTPSANAKPVEGNIYYLTKGIMSSSTFQSARYICRENEKTPEGIYLKIVLAVSTQNAKNM